MKDDYRQLHVELVEEAERELRRRERLRDAGLWERGQPKDWFSLPMLLLAAILVAVIYTVTSPWLGEILARWLP